MNQIQDKEANFSLSQQRAQNHSGTLCNMFASKEMLTNQKTFLSMAQIREILLMSEL